MNSGFLTEPPPAVRVSRCAKGLVKELKSGLVGLIGFSSRSSTVRKGLRVICQSNTLCRSSETVRNRRVFDQGSLEDSPPVLLDRRFLAFSNAISGFISSIRVGREGLCFLWATSLISQDLNVDIGCCARYSQSPYRN